ncbi:hypothetical protein CRE_17003 [Caenorhabditis remanei]|uniref:Uncharacterized protein n=1 Tax=Caenorhabditis remanei TaxID=31234 RepID=E3N7X4_CAERE|nr:hypothetical protein CRE_17003 [Caenorhabditis remanei]
MMNSIHAQMNLVREFDAHANQYRALKNTSVVLAGVRLNFNNALKQALKENGDLKAIDWNLEAEGNAAQYDLETMEETIHFMSKRMDLQDKTIKGLQYQLAAQKLKKNKLIEDNLQLNENLKTSVAQNATLQEEELMSKTMGIISVARNECGYQSLDGEKKTVERKPRKSNNIY